MNLLACYKSKGNELIMGTTNNKCLLRLEDASTSRLGNAPASSGALGRGSPGFTLLGHLLLLSLLKCSCFLNLLALLLLH